MASSSTLLIIGGGLAGAKAAEGAREGGFEGRIVLVAEEARDPYERPPLSKDILRGEKEADSSRVHESGYYDEHSIELVTGDPVASLDAGAKRVALRSGESIAFDTAVLATGAAPRRLTLAGGELSGVHYLPRSRIRSRCRTPSREPRGWRSSGPAGSARRSRHRPGRWVPRSC